MTPNEWWKMYEEEHAREDASDAHISKVMAFTIGMIAFIVGCIIFL